MGKKKKEGLLRGTFGLLSLNYNVTYQQRDRSLLGTTPLAQTLSMLLLSLVSDFFC